MPFVVVVDDPAHPGGVVLVETADDGSARHRTPVAPGDLPAAVARRESDPSARPRWVWDDTARRYPPLLEAGVRVERCHDLRLCHAILRRSVLCAGSRLAEAPAGPWDAARPDVPAATAGATTLFDAAFGDDAASGDDAAFDHTASGAAAHAGGGTPDPVAALGDQLEAVAGSREPGRLRLLLAAESTGALIAAEMRHDGMPWDVRVHDRTLTAALGERPRAGGRPRRLEAVADQVRAALDRPGLNVDSQPELLAALRAAGLDVTSTRKGEIRGLDHPVVEPLLEHKRLSRLLSANGWTWMQTWVQDGRFRPDYVPGGVVTGRWATSGGGALQLPADIRAAVRADPGWRLVVADAAQLEPRVLAAMSGDDAMAAAGRAADLYQGLVAAGVVQTREQAKYAMLGALYGATSGASGALVPRLTRAYPRALGLVERAARAGEHGEVVSTWLGRTSPAPSPAFLDALHAASGEGADAEEVRAVRRRARDWGRFTRNFVVQGTAAEWALCWMASLRRRLRDVEGRPHLVFFLHDEVMVHAPEPAADAVADAVRAAAAEAGRLLFGAAPVEFPLSVSVVESYDQAS
ncbi:MULTISPECIES: bifunctional 3'-5' exonuclease/DNA polymerase [unclassified Actinotalea]|uniref:bifunctional 3'-5' exonuclease/DNA polymerase n=1 Tax=unclassified Actinotalea TaxID=2638618 RepID=UPI0015F438CA|nr:MULTISPECIES: bifunctional 3'-5' exonuclease/DNA polymerase [unclassified Actinotalea]